MRNHRFTNIRSPSCRLATVFLGVAGCAAAAHQRLIQNQRVVTMVHLGAVIRHQVEAPPTAAPISLKSTRLFKPS